MPRQHGLRDGSDTPRAYLERCLETIKEREPVVRAFAALNEAGARAAADASTCALEGRASALPHRWHANRHQGPTRNQGHADADGLCGLCGNFPKRDNAAVWALRQAGAVILGKTTTAELGGAHPPRPPTPSIRRAPPEAPPPARRLRSQRACSRLRSARRLAAPSSARPAFAAMSR